MAMSGLISGPQVWSGELERFFSLPPQPSIEQLRKRAREFQRAVRAGRSFPLELVGEYSPGPVDPESFTLTQAQLATGT